MTRYPLLDTISEPAQVRKLDRRQLPQLADELRAFLLESVARTGGHLSSNLGTVELTVALHHVFDTPHDRLVWDVGHQTYAHKVLTGRRSGMGKLRMRGGVSGFPKRSESSYDTFGVGHLARAASTRRIGQHLDGHEGVAGDRLGQGAGLEVQAFGLGGPQVKEGEGCHRRRGQQRPRQDDRKRGRYQVGSDRRSARRRGLIQAGSGRIKWATAMQPESLPAYSTKLARYDSFLDHAGGTLLPPLL